MTANGVAVRFAPGLFNARSHRRILAHRQKTSRAVDSGSYLLHYASEGNNIGCHVRGHPASKGTSPEEENAQT